MFKTDEYIEKFAKLLTDQMEMENYTKEQVCIAIEEVLKDFQKDLLESASEGFEECFKNGRNGNGETPSQIEVWQACALFHKAQIDTLKQRELGYQSDLRQKDEEIERLEKELQEAQHINQSEALLNTSLSRKCQQAVKDIEWLTQLREYDTYTELDKLYAIQAKYGLNKQESKE